MMIFAFSPPLKCNSGELYSTFSFLDFVDDSSAGLLFIGLGLCVKRM